MTQPSQPDEMPAAPHHSAALERRPELLHLRAFEAIQRLGSLTAAAQSLGLTQPALSKSLALLRRYYDDELFTRSKAGMRPTALARRLLPGVQQVLQLLDQDLGAHTHFDARVSKRVFRLACTEVGAIHFMPRLLAQVGDSAPGVRWEILPLSAADSEQQLADGELDLLLAAFTELGPRICSERLYTARHVCLVREQHPRIGAQMDLRQFCAERHVVATINHPQHAYSQVERAIQQAAGPQAIGLRVPSLLTAPYIVAQSDLVFTVTEMVGAQMAQLPGLRRVNCPLPLAPIAVHQYWHSRYNADPAVLWLRELIASNFRSP